MAPSGGIESQMRSLLRLVAGLTFSCHGFQKIFGLFGGMGGFAAHAFTLPWFAGILETIGGPLIILGLFTRYTAFILAGEMAVGYFMVHFRRGFWPITNGGELAVLYCFVFLYFFATGPGSLSIDALMRKKTG